MKPTLAYLHGFLSGPTSSKGRYLANKLERRFSEQLYLLDLNSGGGPSMLTHEGAFKAVDACWHAQGSAPLRLIGSSFGGWTAATYAARHPDRVERLVLLCPGFDLAERWEHIVGGAEQLAAWEARGSRKFMVPSSGAHVNIPWAFAANCRNYPAVPQPGCRTTIIHGEHDNVVPWRGSEAFTLQDRAKRKLVLVDDDHSLTSSTSVVTILDEVAFCFDLRG